MRALHLLIIVSLSLFGACLAKESYHEELTLHPLSNNNVLSVFRFTVRRPQISSPHYDLFPRVIGQLMETYQVGELHLTLTQGRWLYHRWGYGPESSAAPTGVELYAWQKPLGNGNETLRTHLQVNNSTKSLWTQLTHTLAGVFCASLNFIDDTVTSHPVHAFKPMGPSRNAFYRDSDFDLNEYEFHYSALPRETVCTENLTPWVKLLPCKSKSGLARLLNSIRLYDSQYHSMALHVRPVCVNSDCSQVDYEMVQSLTTVSHLTNETWSLSSIFDKKWEGACKVAETSRMYVTEHESLQLETPATRRETHHGRSLHVFDLKQSNEWSDLQFHSVAPLPHTKPRFQVQRYLTGYGSERGGLAIELSNHAEYSLPVTVMEVLPWFMRLYMHTLHVVLRQNGKSRLANGKMNDLMMNNVLDMVNEWRYTPALDRERQALIEGRLTLPAQSTLRLTLEFDKTLLKYTEYPPDPNRGFDVGSASILVPLPLDKDIIMPHGMDWLVSNSSSNSASPLPVRITTETLLVVLPTPDFSMPYNVITFTCTLVALFFGSVFNMITRLFQAEKRGAAVAPLPRLLARIKAILFQRRDAVKQKTQ